MTSIYVIADTTPSVTTDADTLIADCISQAAAGTATEAELIAIANDLRKAFKGVMRCIQNARAYDDAN